MVPQGDSGTMPLESRPGKSERKGGAGFGPPAIVCGSGGGRVSAGLADGVLWIVVENEPTGHDIVSCLRQARETRLIATSSDTLVDLTRFKGVVDWDALHLINQMAPWGLGWTRPPRIAYVSRDRLFGAVIRAVGGIFTSARHRLFRDGADALAWLRQSAN